jgi:hypothetical protein
MNSDMIRIRLMEMKGDIEKNRLAHIFIILPSPLTTLKTNKGRNHLGPPLAS